MKTPRIADSGAARRTAERYPLALPGRVTWRDSRGMTRFASVVTRDVSDSGVYLECRGADAIPLYRLVYLQLDRGTRDSPGSLRRCATAACCRRCTASGPCEPTTGTPSGYALRLLVEPSRLRVDVSSPIETLHLERAHLFNVSDLGLDLSARPDDLGIGNVADGALPNSFRRRSLGLMVDAGPVAGQPHPSSAPKHAAGGRRLRGGRGAPSGATRVGASTQASDGCNL